MNRSLGHRHRPWTRAKPGGRRTTIRASFPTLFRRRATSDRRGWGLVRLLVVSGREPDRCCAAKPPESRRRPHKPRRRRPVDLPSPPRVRTHLHHHPPLLEPTSLVDRWFKPIHAITTTATARTHRRLLQCWISATETEILEFNFGKPLEMLGFSPPQGARCPLYMVQVKGYLKWIY